MSDRYLEVTFPDGKPVTATFFMERNKFRSTKRTSPASPHPLWRMAGRDRIHCFVLF